MSSYVPRVLVLLALALAAAIAPVRTNAQENDRMVMTIPFAFSAGGATLPAGTYVVARTSLTSSAFRIRSAEGHAVTSVMTHGSLDGGRQPVRAKLVFHRYGDAYYLAEVWTPSNNIGCEVQTSKHERELAERGAKPELVAVLAPTRE